MDPTPPPSMEPVEPRRSATHTVYGFLYQTALAVERWLQLQPGEWIFCEGDEDFDLLTPDGARSAVQAKAYSGRLGLNDPAVKESLIGFRNAFVARRRAGQQQSFQFVTTASSRERGDAAAILDSWRSQSATPEVVAFVRALLADGSEAARWLDEVPDGWREYVAAVSWSFDAPDLDRTLRSIEKALAADERSRHLPSSLIARRLLYELLDASRQRDPKDRCRSAEALAALLHSTESDLQAWAADPRINERLRELLDVRHLDELLVPGTRSLPARDQLRSVGQLLGAAYEAVPWNDQLHEDVVQNLQDWCNLHETIEVQVIVGDGGAGKTRLGIELVKRLRRDGWKAGFLTDVPAIGTQVSADNEEQYREKAFRLLRGTAPRLVVIDYAETHASWIAMLLQVVCDARSQGIATPVRFLLLARNAQEWWLAIGNRRPAVADLQREVRIRDLSEARLDGPVRELLFSQAVQMYSQMLGKRPVGAQPHLGGDEFHRVLYVHMAALALVEGTTVHGREQVLRATLDHERRFWSRAIERHEVAGERRALERTFPRAATAMTLVQGAVDEAEAYRYLARAVTRLGPKDEDVVLPALVGLLRTVYSAEDRGGGEARFLAAVEPDVLGEFLIADVLTADAAEPRHPGVTRQLLDVLFPEPWDDKLLPAFVVVGRAASCDPRHERWILQLLKPFVESRVYVAAIAAIAIGRETAYSPLGRLVAQSLEGRHDYELARTLASLIPDQTVSLLELSVWTLSQPSPVEGRHFKEALQSRAGRLNNLGVRLSQLGRKSEALDSTQKAVQECRMLARSNELFLPDLAMYLSNLACRLSEIGNPKAALAPARESISIRRMLVSSKDPRHMDLLADSLNNFASFLSRAGEKHVGILAAREATAIYSEAASAVDRSATHRMAMSMHNLGSMMFEHGLRIEALEIISQAVGHTRQLYRDNPDAYAPSFSMALLSLSTAQSALGHHDEGLQSALESFFIRKALATQRPDSFNEHLGMTCYNIGIIYKHLGRTLDAYQFTKESVEIRRRLSTKFPDAFDCDLAKSLNNLGMSAMELCRFAEAVDFMQQSVAIYRRRAAIHGSNLPELAVALAHLSKVYMHASLPNEAAEASTESVAIYQLLASSDPVTFWDRANIATLRHQDLISAIARPQQARPQQQ